MAPDTLLWLSDTATLPDAAWTRHAAWLGESERARLARFVRAERRRQFIAGRALLRLALGRLLGLAPESFAIEERPGRAPALAVPAGAGVSFSISHSGAWVACAASTATEVGVDIERLDPARDVLALAEHSFSYDDVEALRLCPQEERTGLFYRLWCRYEAHIKLARPSGRDYPFELPGLAGALSCAAPLAAAPRPLLVSLDG
ncbi:MAG: 4'-phosphopantetheinyl transferase superfamily protein [Pseudomonadota bacterium]